MRRTLLLADDSVTIQRVIELTFAEENIKVIAVSDGDEAIERIRASPPDIVLADVGMPGRTGYEVAQFIKQSPELAHIPVVLLTGAFEPVDQVRAAEAGCDGVLAKPFEPQLVINRVRELLAKRGLDDAFDVDPAAPAVRHRFIEDDLIPPVAPAPRAPAPAQAAAAPADTEVDDYFDRLDAAFSNLSASGRTAPKSDPSLTLPDELDWPGRVPERTAASDDQWDLGPIELAPSTIDLPLAAERKAELPQAPAAPEAPPQVTAPPHQVTPLLPGHLPLADAFAALLAAEQNQPPPGVAAGSSGVMVSPVNMDDLVEEASRRVISRLSDTVVRETVADIVSKVAETLVQEEIDRIKSSIK